MSTDEILRNECWWTDLQDERVSEICVHIVGREDCKTSADRLVWEKLIEQVVEIDGEQIV